MPLIACPECGKQISSAATTCPHCGFPNPSKATQNVETPVAAVPSASKEDVSGQFPVVPVDAQDSFEAAKQIIRQLNRLRAEGWTTGQAFAGQDGINQYHIENAAQKAVLRFDLTPTIRRGASAMLLTIHTMGAAAPECTEQKIDELKRLNRGLGRQVNRSGCLVSFIALAFGMIGVISVFIVCFRFL